MCSKQRKYITYSNKSKRPQEKGICKQKMKKIVTAPLPASPSWSGVPVYRAPCKDGTDWGLLLWIIDIDLGKNRSLVGKRKDGACKMMKFSTDSKWIRARPIDDRTININSQRGECKCCIVLANFFFKIQTMWTCAIKKISEIPWSGRKWRKINLATETTHSKFWLSYSRLW